MHLRLFFGIVLGLGASMPVFDRAPQKGSDLFTEEKPLEFTLAADLKALYRDRDTASASYHPGTLSYVDSSGMTVKLEVRLKTRGIWRRAARNCQVPPLRLSFKGAAVKHTIFAKQSRLKLTTYCRDDDAYEQYVLSEYTLYKIYNRITPLSYRVRLARVTYAEAGAPNARTVTRTGFLIEDEDAMVARNRAVPMNVKGAHWGDLDPQATATMAAFEYMIGNTDWSAYGLHNIKLMRDTVAAAIIPVAHDFDFSGAVNAHYATPDPRIGVKSVRDRAYRGNCISADEWTPIIAHFDAERHAIDSIIGAVPGLKRDRANDLRDYLHQFYDLVDDKGRRKSELITPCRPYAAINSAAAARTAE